jgi:hypothetical protein
MRNIPAIAMRHGLDVVLVPNATVRFGRIPRCSGAEDHFSSKRNGEEISS